MTDLNRSDDLRFAQLDRYVAGNSSMEEAESVRAWLAEDTGHPEVLAMVRAIRQSAIVPPAITPDEAWERAARKFDMKSTLGAGDAASTVQTASQTSLRFPDRVRMTSQAPRMRTLEWFKQSTWARIGLAASVAIIAAVAVHTTRQVHHRSISLATVSDNAEYATVRGQRATIRLRDGSLVTLAPDSRLTFVRKGNVRQAILIGQAQFLVSNAERSPFVVKANNVETRVLGTEFSVRSYPGETQQQVVVTSGKVAVGDLVLSANDVAMITSGKGPQVFRNADVRTMTGWTNGRLTFRGESLAYVVAELRRWYDLDIQVADASLLSRQLHTTIADDTPAEAFDLLARALDVRVKQDGRTVVISAK